MRIGLLGELEVLDDEERVVVVAGAKRRALLALLALQVGRVVPTEQLIDALWGEAPPAGVRNGLQGLASKLRRALGSGELVAMRGDGYSLELPPEAIDVHRHEQLVAAGRAAAVAGDVSGAVALLLEAESLWRGDPLVEFAYEDFAGAVITRLSELRLAVLEERLDLELRLGRHHGVIGQLEALVAAHPLREQLRGSLMVALYRAGRQADALRTFQEGRHLLGEELGLEPGHELRRLEAAILAQDPSLELTAAGTSAGAVPVTVPVTVPATAPRSTIPESLTPLVGRSGERIELARLLAEHRLLTLVGPGGVGKTRLAVEVGRAESAGLALGGCLVELAPVGDPAGVRAAIAAALELPDPGGLAEVIGDRELLLVLDNCEHVIATAAAVAEDLLRRCPGLRILATSREGLRIGGETIWPVPPLAADDAVGLFVARARATGAPFELSGDDLELVSDICARLDGLPLAIELAAARTRAFPLQQIAARLHDRFRLLTGGSRTALPRQQTLRAVVDWSYELLFEDEQRVFERLAVFPGGCDLSTAEAVCADELLAAEDLHDVIHALVEKSLVIAVPGGAVPRFGQLQTLAQYGREKLAERGDAAAVRGAMAAHYAGLCARSAAAYMGDEQRSWLTAIDRERDNLRAALEWAVANDDAETALTIAGGTSWPHWLAGMVAEGRRWLDDAFACGGEASEATRALALTGRGLIEFLAGAPQRADADLETALVTFRQRCDVPSMVLAHSFYSEIAVTRGDVAEAIRRRREVLAFYTAQPDDPFVVAAREYSLAKLAMLEGDLARSERQYRLAAHGFARIDRPVMSSICLGMVADFDERAGDYAAAARTLQEAIATNESLGLRGFTGTLTARLGWALLHLDDVAAAEAMYAHALEGARRLRNAPVVFLALSGMAVLHRLHGRDDEAAAAGAEAIELFLAGGPRRFRNRIDPEADMLEGAAACCSVLGVLVADSAGSSGSAGSTGPSRSTGWERAAHLLGHAAHLRDRAGAPVPPFQRDDLERAQQAIRVALGDDGFEAAFEHGRSGELAAFAPSP